MRRTGCSLCLTSLPSLLALISLVLIFVAGCATRQVDEAGKQLELSAIQPLVLKQAWQDEDEFVFRFTKGGQTLLGRAASEALPVPVGNLANGYAMPSLRSFYYTPNDAPGKDISGPSSAAKALPVMAAPYWLALRDRLLKRLLPEPETGLVLDFDYAAYFLYYDTQGKFQAVPLPQKPTAYRMVGNLDLTLLMRDAEPLLGQLLNTEGIESTEVVFATGDTGLYALPFLYVNLATRELVFFRDDSLVEPGSTDLSGAQSAQAMAHLLRSHLSDLYLRPFSTLYRLVYLVTDTTLATVVRFDWVTGLAEQPVPPLANQPPMDLPSWEAELDELTGETVVNGTVDLLVDGKAYFDRLLPAFEQAQQSIDLQTYIFDNDDYAVQVGNLLKQRSNDGVKVRVLLDGLGTIAATMTDSASLPAGHQPPVSVSGFLEQDSNIRVRQQSNPWLTSDHAKATIIDGQVAFIGGMNIGREYRYDWHDLMVELRGPVVDELGHEFNRAWARAGLFGGLAAWFAGQPDHADTNDDGVPLRILLTEPGNLQIYSAQLAAAKRAQSHIYVQNAYFTDDRMLRELVKARRRGVDVRVIIPVETDHGPITRSNVLAANLMLEHGIRVYIYPGFSHVKAALFDGWACLGSANFDRLSLRINRELNIASSSTLVSQQLLERLFAPDFANSPELKEPIPDRWVDHLVEIIGDYLY